MNDHHSDPSTPKPQDGSAPEPAAPADRSGDDDSVTTGTPDAGAASADPSRPATEPAPKPGPADGTPPSGGAAETPRPDPQPTDAGAGPRQPPAGGATAPAGPLPPRGPIGPRNPPPGMAPPPGMPTTGYPAAPPHSGPPTGQFPIVGPAGQPMMTAPAKPKSKTPLVIAAALVLALGAGGAGGVAGYALAAGNDTGTASPSELIADGTTISDIAKKVQPSVVSLATENAGGSGVILDDSGHIITNNHVAETATGGELEVTFADGTTAPAEVVGSDPAGDLAVIKVDGVDNLTPIEMGDSGALDVGDTVLAVGSPLGLDGSVTSGIVSALDRTVQAGGGEQGGQATTLRGLIQTDAAINPGNSGGALVNGKGELIGINTVIATAGASKGSVGLGFAIPSSTVAATAEQLKEGGDVERGYLGVSVVDNVSGSEGAVITQVADDSPAAEAGLRRGDVITAVDGNAIGGAADVGAAVQGAEPGTEIDITYVRDGNEESTTATLGSA